MVTLGTIVDRSLTSSRRVPSSLTRQPSIFRTLHRDNSFAGVTQGSLGRSGIVSTRTSVPATRSYMTPVASFPGAAATPTAASSQQGVAAMPAQQLVAAMPASGGLALDDISASITTMGSDIFNTFGKYIPLAIKIIIAVIVIKIVLALVRGRKR